MREGIRRYLVTIVVAFATASVAAGGTAFAIIANADKVDGYHANQLTRLARSSTTGPALSGTDGIVRTARITAPKRGFLFIVASSDVFNFTSTDFVNCWVNLDGTQLTSSVRSIELDGGVSNQEENCNTDASWPVGPGLHTVTFEGDDVNADTTFDESTLEVLYVPFNGKGAVPVPVNPTSVNTAGN